MLSDAVESLRHFNRTFTPKIGALDESFLGTGRPLAAARLLYEIGLGDVTVHELRSRLDADPGYLSRLLKGLTDDGVVELRRDPVDGRRRIATLTTPGRAEWAELDRRSDRVARSVLAPLDAAQQRELADALATADRLLRLTTVSFKVVEPDCADALASMRAYFAELDERFPGGFDVGDGFGDELDEMRAPTGAFVLVDDAGHARGCGGLHRFDERTAEIKRMWLHPSLRGLGTGKRLLGRLETLAVELGYRAVVLDTNEVLTQALAMYHAAGYESIERYNDNPYAQRWFAKQLRP